MNINKIFIDSTQQIDISECNIIGNVMIDNKIYIKAIIENIIDVISEVNSDISLSEKLEPKKKFYTSFVDASHLNLTPNEINVIEIYTGGESLWINNFLRDRNLNQLNIIQKDLMKKYALTLNNIIKKSPPSKIATTVYRGAEPMDEKWKNLSNGDELLFTQKGIISTTFDINIAIDFIEKESNCCLLILRLPKGTNGLYISNMSVFNKFGEDELLLPHGSKFLITKRLVKSYNNRSIITYYADLIQQ